MNDDAPEVDSFTRECYQTLSSPSFMRREPGNEANPSPSWKGEMGQFICPTLPLRWEMGQDPNPSHYLPVSNKTMQPCSDLRFLLCVLQWIISSGRSSDQVVWSILKTVKDNLSPGHGMKQYWWAIGSVASFRGRLEELEKSAWFHCLRMHLVYKNIQRKKCILLWLKCIPTLKNRTNS